MRDESASVTQDIVLKWTDLVLSQTADVWGISLTFFVFSVLILAGLHGSNAVPGARSSTIMSHLNGFQKKSLFFLMYISCLFSASSLFFSYSAKGALVAMYEKIYNSGEWKIDSAVESDNFYQIVLIFASLSAFTAAFVLFRRTIGAAIASIIKGG